MSVPVRVASTALPAPVSAAGNTTTTTTTTRSITTTPGSATAADAAQAASTACRNRWQCENSRCRPAPTAAAATTSTPGTLPTPVNTYDTLDACFQPCEKFVKTPFTEPINANEGQYNLFQGAILFTNIKGSSRLWRSSAIEMNAALDAHAQQVRRLSNIFHGSIVKNIGDSHMLLFEGTDALRRAVQFALTLQQEMSSGLLQVKQVPLRIRVGIASGPIYVKYTVAQDKTLRDYFGNTVNTASRAESKVARESGIAYGIVLSKTGTDLTPTARQEAETAGDQVLDLVPECYDVDINAYQARCDTASTTRTSRNRSGRLVPVRCVDLEDLSGVDDVIMYNLIPRF